MIERKHTQKLTNQKINYKTLNNNQLPKQNISYYFKLLLKKHLKTKNNITAICFLQKFLKLK